ncbi:hypothetical protein [Klebsiella aerogenes]|uniref:hypothetical protein n=1 Tax=Klebsiella aerogenes TaxID=548 RepID=UPI001F1FE104|nr:hypothetical protein [Klebsiella aerogenes]
MPNMKSLEATALGIARKEGVELNGQERLVIRTHLAQSVSARRRYREQMEAKPYEWKKPAVPRR